MKGKSTLAPLQEDPEIEYKNDTFHQTNEFEPINRIGTIRTQYDWQELSDPSLFEIDPKIVEKIQPVLDFANHAVELQSTKDNVLIFLYKGNMRHLIGVQANMKKIAKKYFPEMTDLRLETPRASDKFDT